MKKGRQVYAADWQGDAWKKVAELRELAIVAPDTARRECLQLLVRCANADDGFLILATCRGASARRVKDPVDGFRIHLNERAVPLSSAALEKLLALVSDHDYINDPAVQRHTQRRDELWLERGEARRTPTMLPALRAFLDTVGYEDDLTGGIPLGRGAHFRVGLYRTAATRPYREADCKRTLALIPALLPTLKRVASWHGVFEGEALLAPREEEMFRYLIGASSEKQIAAAMNLTTRSAHQVVLSVYRRLGVSSRVELIRLWLQGGAPQR